MGAGVYLGTIGRGNLRTGTGSASGNLGTSSAADVIVERLTALPMFFGQSHRVSYFGHSTAGADATEARLAVQNHSDGDSADFELLFEYIDD